MLHNHKLPRLTKLLAIALESSISNPRISKQFFSFFTQFSTFHVHKVAMKLSWPLCACWTHHHISLTKLHDCFTFVSLYDTLILFISHNHALKILATKYMVLNFWQCEYDTKIWYTGTYLGHVARKPVFGVSHEVIKPACLATETSWKIAISLMSSLDMILSNMHIKKALIRLRGCAGWSAPLLFANTKNRVSCTEAHLL